MLCGVPASWFSKSMTNGVSAGAVTVGVVNAIPDATTFTDWPAPPPDAAGEPDRAAPGGAAPDGAADEGAPDAPGDPDGDANSSAQHAGYGVAPGAGL